MNFVELRGSKAGASWKGGDVKMFTEVAGTLCDVSPRLSKHAPNGHMANLRHFADVVLRGAKPVFEPQQGVDMIKILTAIYRSAESGREVRL